MTKFRSIRRLLAPLASVVLAAILLPGCAHKFEATPVFTATATASMKPEMTRSDARIDAIHRAEVMARDQIMTQAAQMRLPNGQTLENMAVVDPFIRAVLMDSVRAAQITDRTVNEEGLVTVTISMQRAPLDKMLAGYTPPPVGK